MPETNTHAEELLAALYNAGNQFLSDYPWEFEEDRSAELLVCSLIVDAEISPETARDAIETLKKFGLVDPLRLSSLSPELQAFVKQLFLQLGCNGEQSEKATNLLSALGAMVKKTWDGYLQRFLREHGRKMVAELGAILNSAGISDSASRKIATLWLQNVANVPVLLSSDRYIQAFCREHQLSDTELVETADRLGLNISVLDDLLAMEQMASSQDGSKGAGKKSKAKAA